MPRELQEKIEASRIRLHAVGWDQKEKLLKESRTMDLLIVAFHRLNGAAGSNKNTPAKQPLFPCGRVE